MNKVTIYGPCSKWSEEAHAWKTEIPAVLLEAQGYQKLPEDSIVIPKKITDKTKPEDLIKIAKYNESVCNQASKETAKKYHAMVKNLFDMRACCGCIEDSPVEEWHKDNDNIAKQFGIETKE